MTRDEFLNRIETFLAAHEMSPAAFGRNAVKDPNFILDLRNGRSPSLKMVERVEQYMAEVEQQAA